MSRRTLQQADAGSRRQSILEAALEEFSARGFAASRLDDVAKRAGVAKGTIYLYFADKEELFQELVRSVISPVVGAVAAIPENAPLRPTLEWLLDVFVREVYGTRRKDVLRLILTEGRRFPSLAEFYYQEVIARVLPAVRALCVAAQRRGEVGGEALVLFPQLLIAPGLMAILWDGLFDRFEPLDVAAMMRAHIDLVLGTSRP